MRCRVRFLDLAQDFRLAEHHRVQSACDFQEMSNTFVVVMFVEMSVNRISQLVVLVKESAHRLRRIVRTPGQAINLDAVTGGQDCGFVQRRGGKQAAGSLAKAGTGKCQPFAHFHRRAAVIQTDHNQVHECNKFTPQKPASIRTNEAMDARATLRPRRVHNPRASTSKAYTIHTDDAQMILGVVQWPTIRYEMTPPIIPAVSMMNPMINRRKWITSSCSIDGSSRNEDVRCRVLSCRS